MIIGIAGRAGAGKDTVAKIIRYLSFLDSSKDAIKLYPEEQFLEHLSSGYNLSFENEKWQTVRFADKLKDCVCLILGCTREQLEDRYYKEFVLGEEWWYYRVFVANTRQTLPSKFVLYPYKEYKGKWKEHVLVKPTPRMILQNLGTDAGRNQVHPDIWVNATMSDYRPNVEIDYMSAIGREYREGDIYVDTNNVEHVIGYPDWVIPDVRFPNETQAIRNRGGALIRVDRPCWYCGKYTNPECDSIYHSMDKHESETALNEWTDWDFIIRNNYGFEELYKDVKKYELHRLQSHYVEQSPLLV